LNLKFFSFPFRFRYRDPCSLSLNEDDSHTITLVGNANKKAVTLAKTCEQVDELRDCRAPRDWSILALQNTRTGKSHYLVICKCPSNFRLGKCCLHALNKVLGSNSQLFHSFLLIRRGPFASRSTHLRGIAWNQRLRNALRATKYPKCLQPVEDKSTTNNSYFIPHQEHNH
jgi:hypothetical protein